MIKLGDIAKLRMLGGKNNKVWGLQPYINGAKHDGEQAKPRATLQYI